MSPRWLRDYFPRPEAPAGLPLPEPQGGRLWCFWAVLAFAFLVRLVWLDLYRNFIGIDAIRYLWISQHVSRGEWQLLPQLWTSPLLPALTGLLARLTEDHLLAGRIIGILSNTLAVGLAMLLVRRLFPERPTLAWLTGLGLAVNHVWCWIAPFVLTDSLYYLLLFALFVLMALILDQVTWGRAMAFGLAWGLLFLSREIGLYCGLMVFLCLMTAIFFRNRKSKGSVRQNLGRFNIGSLSVLALILLLWGAWYYHGLGIISIGEGSRFYASYTHKFERKGRHPHYENGTMSFFQLRPYELMEFTRFPRPDDERYPPSVTFTLLSQPAATLKIIWDNLIFTFRQTFRATQAGFLTIFLFVPLGLVSRRLSLPESVYWVFGATLGVLGLHFLGPVREDRIIGWFFFWLYLGLAGFTLWLWRFLHARTSGKVTPKLATILVAGLFIFHITHPTYFRRVPRHWSVRLAPQVHALASQKILESSGFGAVIASREPEVVYRSGGYWIGLPYGTPEEMVAWLYLGGANYLLLHDVAPIPEEEIIFWADPQELQEKFPELKVVADFNLTKTSAYGKHGRLLHFEPQPDKFGFYREKFPWAGTHPRTTGAWAPESAKVAPAEKPIEN